MELNKKNYLLEELQQLAAVELEEQLHIELRSEEPDGELVRTILQILEERDQQYSHKQQNNGELVWEKYKVEAVKNKKQYRRSGNKTVRTVAAIVAMIVLVVFALPQAANANNIVDLMAKWSDSLFAFFKQTEIEHEEYVFKTDNPGLQQVYDAVVEMGITVPVVPMWLEDGYELLTIEKNETAEKNRLHAILQKNEKSVIFTVTRYWNEISYAVHKDKAKPIEYESSGILHYVSPNNSVLAAFWKRDNIVCTLSVDCREETLYKILDSIYTTEDD